MAVALVWVCIAPPFASSASAASAWHRLHYHPHHPHHRYDYYPYHYSFSFGYYGYPVHFGAHYAPRPYTYPGPGMGAVDLNVRPKKAEVYLDGRYIGVVDNFDGFPGYLWLEKGTYELVFYFPGYATSVRTITIQPGVVIDVRDRMVEGESIPPPELEDDGDDRGRAPADGRRRYDDGEDVDRGPRQERGGAPRSGDLRRDPARLRLDVRPADASIYMDGRFVGTAEELSSLHSALLLDPGDHLLEAVRPGYRTAEQRFSVVSGEELELALELEPLL